MKKFVSLFLALLTVLSLVACGSKTDTKTDDKSGGSTVTEPANALEKIKADGVLTVALSPDFSPMEFVDSSKIDQDQYVGFDVTLAKYIADGLGVKLQIEAMGFDASQTAVYTGSVPMSISGYSWTEERAKNYELSDYYYAGENETRQALLIKKENADKYTTPEALSGKDVGAQNASLQMQLVTEQLTGANPISIGDITVGVMELKSGTVDGVNLAEELKALKQQNAEREANDAVILALKAGKITPAQKEWAKSYALSDPKGFGSFVEKAPQIVPMDKIELDDVKALKSDALDADTLLVCKQLGISPDDVKKYGMKED